MAEEHPSASTGQAGKLQDPEYYYFVLRTVRRIQGRDSRSLAGAPNQKYRTNSGTLLFLLPLSNFEMGVLENASPSESRGGVDDAKHRRETGVETLSIVYLTTLPRTEWLLSHPAHRLFG